MLLEIQDQLVANEALKEIKTNIDQWYCFNEF
jgi:hypothetical protein